MKKEKSTIRASKSKVTKPEPETKIGRLTKYTVELGLELCKEISTSSLGLVHICRKHNINASSVYEWLKEHEDFSNNYTRAREAQADFLADEIIAIADDSSKDTVKRLTASGEEYDAEDHEWTNRSKLRVDARKWKASKLYPKRYGDKVDVTSAGEKIKSFNVGFGKSDTED